MALSPELPPEVASPDRSVAENVTSPPPQERPASSTDGAGRLPSIGSGFLRLFDFTRKRRLVPLDVHIAPLGGIEASPDDTRHLVKTLRRQAGVRVRTLDRPLAPANFDGRKVQSITGAAREWLGRSAGDLMIWGTVPPPGTTLHLRFVSANASPFPVVGAVNPAGVLGLPIGFEDDFATLIYAVALAAARPTDPAKARSCFYRLATTFRRLRSTIQTLPPTLTSFERASIHAAFGDLAAFLSSAPRYERLSLDAIAAYQAALPVLAASAEDKLPSAVVAMNLGLACIADAEAGADSSVIRTAVDALRQAVDGFEACGHVLAQATASDRLGDALYRLEQRVGDPSLLEQAVSAHRSALAGLSPQDSPDAWAEAQHNLARAAQVLGAQTEHPRWLIAAIDAGLAAQSLRTREGSPIAWAVAQNTIGSAQFLLACRARDPAMLDESQTTLEGARDVLQQRKVTNLFELVERNLVRVAEFRQNLPATSVQKKAR